MAAFEYLKKANPNGRFWIQLNATDLKEALMESMKGAWNGDGDIGDGNYRGREGNMMVELIWCLD